MPMLDLEIHGVKELDTVLRQLPMKMQKRVMNNAVRAGARVIRTEAKKNVKRNFHGHGDRAIHLEKEITVAAQKKRKPWEFIYKIGCGRAYWGRFWEYGYSATGRGKTGQARSTRRAGGRHIPARPWLRPALDEMAKTAIEKIREKISDGIDREIAKLRGPI